MRRRTVRRKGKKGRSRKNQDLQVETVEEEFTLLNKGKKRGKSVRTKQTTNKQTEGTVYNRDTPVPTTNWVHTMFLPSLSLGQEFLEVRFF